MGRLVRSLDMAVELYSGGTELLRSASLAAVDCVITDIQMPVMNGFALCEALRAAGFQKPVILMTAFAHDSYEERAQAAGATCFLSKPFQDTDIIRCIENALPNRPGGPAD